MYVLSAWPIQLARRPCLIHIYCTTTAVCTTVGFTSHGTPVAVAAGNLWFVCAIGCSVNLANRTNHKFPAATALGVPCEVKSTACTSSSDRPCGSTTIELVLNPDHHYSSYIVLLPQGHHLPQLDCGANCCIGFREEGKGEG